MKKFKSCGVVMLPTNKQPELGDSYFNHKHDSLSIIIDKSCLEMVIRYEYKIQYLYIVSSEEIKEKDLIVDLRPLQFGKIERVLKTRKEENAITTEKGKVLFKDQFAKIVATTDSSLKNSTFYEVEGDQSWQLPQIPESFLSHYMSEYNKGNKIEKVEVEYIKDMSLKEGDVHFLNIQVNIDNTINIKPLKESWNKEEVEELLRETYYKGRNDENRLSYKKNPELEVKNWINLKL